MAEEKVKRQFRNLTEAMAVLQSEHETLEELLDFYSQQFLPEKISDAARAVTDRMEGLADEHKFLVGRIDAVEARLSAMDAKLDRLVGMLASREDARKAAAVVASQINSLQAYVEALKKTI